MIPEATVTVKDLLNCAKALIGCEVTPLADGSVYCFTPIVRIYNPSLYGQEVLELIKAATLDVNWLPGEQRWSVGQFRFKQEQGMEDKDGLFCEARSRDLNTAVIKCVSDIYVLEGSLG